MRLLLLAVLLSAGTGAIGCGSTQTVQTPRFVVTMPDHWQVATRADGDGQPTTIVIKRFGSAVIDDGPTSVTPKEQNYEAVQAPVEVRLYTWPDSALDALPEREVYERLKKDPELQIQHHQVVLETSPPECNRYPRKYRLAGAELTPIDIFKRPGWRTIVLGRRDGGLLFGVVARVEFEPADMARNCFNLRNMQVELQNLLDGVVMTAGPPAAAPAKPPETPAVPPPAFLPPPASP